MKDDRQERETVRGKAQFLEPRAVEKSGTLGMRERYKSCKFNL